MTDESPIATSERLMAAGVGVFAEKGYKAATVREICRRAGSSNVNAVSYYFGSKAGLYRKIVERLFAEYDRYDLSPDGDETPEERLKHFIYAYCEMLYGHKGKVGTDYTAIFFAEMARPSPFIAELTDRYNRPRVERHLAMVRAILGPDAPAETVRNSFISIGGQILYYYFTWPVFSRLFPNHPGMDKAWRQWADHVFRFTMGGLAAIKQDLKEKMKG